MGMLQLAGAVSGFGKGLQQGLENTQQYMSQSLLLEERDKNERERLKLTFGHDEGMLQKRLAGERANNIEHAALQNKYTLERDEQRQDFEAGENRKTRQADREKAETQAQKQRELEEYRQQNAVTNKVLDASYDQQKEATKAKQDRAKEAQARADKKAEMEHVTGRDITLKSMELSKPSHAGGASGESSGKWDDTKKARYKRLISRIATLDEKKVMGGLTEAEKEEYDTVSRELNTMENVQNPPLPGAVDISKFDKFKGVSPY